MSVKTVLQFFDAIAPHIAMSLESEVNATDLAGVVEEAREAFVQLLPEVPYVDNPSHTMAESIFFSAVGLAFVKPMQARGLDAHCVGRAIYLFT